MNATLSQIKLRKYFSEAKFSKMQPNALLAWRRFYDAKTGHYICGCRQYVSCLATLLAAVKSLLDVSPDGDDATRPWHLQDQVGIMLDRHEFGECRPSQESVVCSLKINDLKLYNLRAKIFPSPEGYEKRNLTDGGCCCTRDYAMERSPTGVQQRPG
jgi:hypothetical protein